MIFLNAERSVIPLGAVTYESKIRAGETNGIERSVYGVDRGVGLTDVPKYVADTLERYKIVDPGMFAYNPMRLNIGSIGYCSSNHKPGLVSPDYVVFGCKDELLPDFMYYITQTSEWQQWTAEAGVGSVRTRIYFRELARFPLFLPSIEEQRDIVGALRLLDDKIELNRRMNTTLEAIARALFKSWFVDFDPVHSKARGEQPPGMDAETAALFPDTFEDSELGPIPAGWGLTTLAEVIEIFDSQRKPLSSLQRTQRQGIYPYYGAVSVVDYIDDYLFDGVYLLLSEDGAYVVDEKGYPTMQYVWNRFWVNNHAHIVRGINTVSTEQLLLALQHTVISPFITGAVQPKLNQQNMNLIPFLLPRGEINKRFQRIIEPLFAQIRINTEQLITLEETRDALLPKLVSGELRVGDIE